MLVSGKESGGVNQGIASDGGECSDGGSVYRGGDGFDSALSSRALRSHHSGGA